MLLENIYQDTYTKYNQKMEKHHCTFTMIETCVLVDGDLGPKGVSSTGFFPQSINLNHTAQI